MISTSDVIEALIRDARPVRRLRPPALRALGWLLLAALLLALIAIAHGLRPDVAAKWQQPVFTVGIAASATTAILAAIAAFITSLPDRSRRWLLLPLPALAVWMSTLGYGCLTNWVSIQPDGISLGETARCFATIVLVGGPLSVAMLCMLRYAALLAPRSTTLAGSLAIAAMTSTALSLFHPLDATVMILIWNLGVAVLMMSIGGIYGGRALGGVTANRS